LAALRKLSDVFWLRFPLIYLVSNLFRLLTNRYGVHSFKGLYTSPTEPVNLILRIGTIKIIYVTTLTQGGLEAKISSLPNQNKRLLDIGNR